MKMFNKNTWWTHRQYVLMSTLGVLFLVFGCAHKPASESDSKQGRTISPAQEKAISGITVAGDHRESVVTIEGNAALTYTAVKHQFPLGVVLYFPETVLKGIQKTYTPQNPFVETIHTSELKKAPPASRVEIRLAEDIPYQVKREENTLWVTFTKSAQQPGKVAAVHETMTVAKRQSTEKETQRAETGMNSRTVSTNSTKPSPPSEKTEPIEGPDTSPAVVKAIDFKALEGGKSRLTIQTTRKTGYESRKLRGNRLLLTLQNTRIPEFQRRPLITTRFNSAVDRILPVQSEETPHTAVISIELRESVPYIIYQDGDTYTVDFEASTVPPRPMPEANKAEWVQAMQEAREATAPGPKDVPPAPSPEEPPAYGSKKSYTGERISLDFQDADIHNIFRILHEVSGKNFVIGDDVKGNVTLKLVNVPWDQVLDLILQMNNLGTVEEGNIVRIATLSTLEAEQRALTQKAKAEQEAKKLSPLITEFIKLDYADAASIKGHLDEVKTERGKITIDKATNMIIIKDELEALTEAKVLIDHLDRANQEIATRQVMIEARIVEANTNFTRDLGVQWGGDYEVDSDTPWGEGTIFGAGASSSASPNFAVDLPPSSFTSGLGFTFGRIGGTVLNLDIRLLAMEENGKGRTISSPKVLTLDNKKATIKQITKIPYQVRDDETTSIETEDAGIELSVTPQITRDNRIRMVIFAEKGAPDWSNTVNGNPAIDTNTAETELFVNDGQTIVIGGILTTTDTLSQSGVPWLHKIPFIGWLFKQKRTVKQKEELLVFITPKIVRLEEAPGMDS